MGFENIIIGPANAGSEERTTANTLEFIVALILSGAVTAILIPPMIVKLKERGIVGRDLNKPGTPEIPEMGGIAVVVGFFASVSVLLVADGATRMNVLQVSLSTVLGAAFVGMWDDLFDLRQRHKAVLPFLLALPLGATLDQSVYIPFVGEVNLGWLMVLAGPLAITCAANASNMLEGFNGLGTGLGIIMTCTLITLCLAHNRHDGLYILVPLLGGLIAFIWFNKYPSRIFPGDTLLLFIGTALATSAMLSDLHVQTAFIFTPMIAEFFLKLRGNFKGENYCTRTTEGILEYSGKTESITHFIMRRARVTEKTLVWLLWISEISICLFVIAVDLAV